MNPDETLEELLEASGFVIVPVQTIIDALAAMEAYLREQTGLDQDELDAYLLQIEELLGHEETCGLELDEIVAWIRALQEQ
jgi:hypothetical protein